MSFQDQRTLQQVKLQLSQWRSRNSAPTPIPGEIWAKAVRLAGRHGVGHVARALRLDHGALKKRVGTRPASGKTTMEPAATFIELMPAALPTVVGRCVIEVRSSRGDELRLKLNGVAAPALAALVREMLT